MTLPLAYPERASAMLMLGVPPARRPEPDWLYPGRRGGSSPGARARFRYFAGLTRCPAAAGRQHAAGPGAATGWTAREDAVISQESNGSPGAYGGRPGGAEPASARIRPHYLAHDGFPADGVLTRAAGTPAAIPGVLIPGRNDPGGSARTPREPARARPGTELTITGDCGHTASTTTAGQTHAAADRPYEQITNPAQPRTPQPDKRFPPRTLGRGHHIEAIGIQIWNFRARILRSAPIRRSASSL